MQVINLLADSQQLLALLDILHAGLILVTLLVELRQVAQDDSSLVGQPLLHVGIFGDGFQELQDKLTLHKVFILQKRDRDLRQVIHDHCDQLKVRLRLLEVLLDVVVDGSDSLVDVSLLYL